MRQHGLPLSGRASHLLSLSVLEPLQLALSLQRARLSVEAQVLFPRLQQTPVPVLLLQWKLSQREARSRVKYEPRQMPADGYHLVEWVGAACWYLVRLLSVQKLTA